MDYFIEIFIIVVFMVQNNCDGKKIKFFVQHWFCEHGWNREVFENKN